MACTRLEIHQKKYCEQNVHLRCSWNILNGPGWYRYTFPFKPSLGGLHSHSGVILGGSSVSLTIRKWKVKRVSEPRFKVNSKGPYKWPFAR